MSTPEFIGGEPPEVPVVFASRNRLATWHRVHIGPTVDVAGRELTPGGSLIIWKPDGSVADLTEGVAICDVQQPDVSYDATRASWTRTLAN